MVNGLSDFLRQVFMAVLGTDSFTVSFGSSDLVFSYVDVFCNLCFVLLVVWLLNLTLSCFRQLMEGVVHGS